MALFGCEKQGTSFSLGISLLVETININKHTEGCGILLADVRITLIKQSSLGRAKLRLRRQNRVQHRTHSIDQNNGRLVGADGMAPGNANDVYVII
jgi:hypothetical protein